MKLYYALKTDNSNIEADIIEDCTYDEIVFIELKRQRPILKSGKLGKATNDATSEQIEFIAKVNDYKYAYGFVAFGCDEAIKVLVPKSNTK